MRIEQYIQMMDYALWDVIKNGPTILKTQVVEGVTTSMPIKSIEDKAQRRLEVKARSTLMMCIPNEHQLKFNSIKDAKMLMEAIEKRFGRNAATKKTQRNLLKQQYENFTALNSEMLDKTFDRLQNTYLDTISMDDLYNNLKVYKVEVKGMSSSNTNTQNMAFVSSLNNYSTNGAINTAQAVNTDLGIFTADTQVNTANIDNLSDAVICAFLASQPRRKLTVNGNETIGFDKTNVECYNCHKRGHFARECRDPRSQDTKHKESTRKDCTCGNTCFNSFDEFDVKPVVENKSSEEVTKAVRKNPDAPIVEDWVSDDEEENVTQPKIVKKIVKPSIPKIEFVKPRQQEKNARKNVNKVEHNRQNTHRPRGNQRNWNNIMFQRLERQSTNGLTGQRSNRQWILRHMTGNMSYLHIMKKLMKDMILLENSVLFNDIECIVLSPNIKLIDESQVLLGVHRKNNMYNVDLKNIVPKGGLTCLFAKATSDESILWHRRLGHSNFKTMNKLVKGNTIRGLPSKPFENVKTYVACQKGKQHRASLHLFHMDLFGLTFTKSLMKKMYCLVVTDDYSRFTWVFFLSTKDETSGILKSFITRIKNLVDHKVKVIRCDNKTEFKIREMNQFCEMQGKFDGKTNEGFVVGYSMNSKAFRVFNSRKMIVEENLHIRFSENTPNVVVGGPDWIFDIDRLTRIMNYEPIAAGTHSNGYAGTKACDNADDGFQPLNDNGKKVDEDPSKGSECRDQEKDDNVNSTNNVNAASINGVNIDSENISNELPFDPNMPALEDIYHPLDQMIGDLHSTTQTRNMSKNLEKHRPDIMFPVCACARYQVNPKVLHLHDVKKIFRKSVRIKTERELCKNRKSDLVRKRIKRVGENKTKRELCKNRQSDLVRKRNKRSGITYYCWVDVNVAEDAEGVDCLPDAAIFEKLTLMGYEKISWKLTFYKAFFSPQWKFLIHIILQCPGVNTPQSDEDSLKLKELMELCTNLQNRVLDLETTKNTQAIETDSLKKMVKKLEKKKRSRTHKLKILYKVGLTARVESFDDNEDLGEDASKQRRISDIDADEGITLTASRKQQELNDEEKATLFMQLLEKRRKFFLAKRTEEKRNKPPTQAQQRKIMCTYLKNVEGEKLTELKNKSFDSIQKMFNRAFKRVNTFVDFRTKLVEESSKKVEAEVMSTRKFKESRN
nr:putative ribonuclease H-like domain-containing protein [Tanacetum cinerariifolium]